MILIFLVVRGKPLPTRGAIIQNTLGAAPRPRNLLIPTIVGIVVALGFLIFTEGSIRGAVIVTFTVAIIALSQVVVTGFAGQISLAQLTLAGVAAYTMSRLTTDWGRSVPDRAGVGGSGGNGGGCRRRTPGTADPGLAGRGRDAQSRGVPGGILVPQQRVQRRDRRGGGRPGSYAAIAGIGMFALVYLAGVTCVSGGVLAGIMGAGGILFVLLDRAVNLGTSYHVITGVLLVISSPTPRHHLRGPQGGELVARQDLRPAGHRGRTRPHHLVRGRHQERRGGLARLGKSSCRPRESASGTAASPPSTMCRSTCGTWRSSA